MLLLYWLEAAGSEPAFLHQSWLTAPQENTTIIVHYTEASSAKPYHRCMACSRVNHSNVIACLHSWLIDQLPECEHSPTDQQPLQNKSPSSKGLRGVIYA